MPKKMTALDRAKLEITLHRFNFARMHDVMNKVKWQWANVNGLGIPSIDDLMSEAERLLGEAYQENGEISTGGLWAEYDGHNFSLKFVVTDSDSYIEGDKLDEVEEPKKKSKKRDRPAIRNAISSLEINENKP